MSDKSINVKKNPLSNKIKKLKDIRHEIKKKRVIFDENKEKFGLEEFSQLTKVKNTSEIKGYPFRGKKIKYTDMQFGIKIVPIETKYDKHEHPCNLENLVLKELTDKLVNTNISPHITYYLGTQKISNKSKALKMLNLKRLEVEDKIRTHSNMLISEFVEGGSLDNWVFDVYENDKEITDNQWKSIVFQLIYTIFIIQRYYKMMHNDFHYGNILIDNSIKASGYLVYDIDDKRFYIKNTGIIPKLWDFEFCMVYSNKIKDCYANKFIIGSYEYDKKLHKTIIDSSDSDSALKSDDLNVPFNYNEVYDIHYFLTSLLDLYISQELFDWIIGLYPRELIPDEENSTSDNTTSDNTTSDNSNTTSDNTTSDNTTSDNTTSDNTRDSLHEKLSKLSVNGNSDSISTLNTNTLNSSLSYNKYLSDGRLVNGVEDMFNLPTPIDLIRHNFFNELTVKPQDFDENDAIYFRAGF